MTPMTALLSGCGLGAGLMYLADPDTGRRRRARGRDQLNRLLHDTERGLSRATRDIRNRAAGTAAAARSAMSRQKVDDDILVARVRSTIGRAVTHPSSIEVSAHEGAVTLRGPVLHAEVERLIDTVRGVRGVSDVRNELEPHEQATGVPGLQGGPSRRRARANTPELMQENWSPGIRLCAGSAAASMIVMAAAKRDLLGLGLGLIGGVMLSRAITNESLGRVTGVSAGRRAVDIVKTIEIGAPIEEVWAFWNNFENFPKFMTHVLEVRDLGNGRSHWVAEGPTGMQVAWDAEITRSVPNQVLAWKSVPGSRVDNAGVLRFDPGAHGGTRVHIRFSYNPPGGAIGHAIAWLFGRDAKTEMDEDLVRLKSLLEDGRTLSRDRRRVMRGDLTAPAPTM